MTNFARLGPSWKRPWIVDEPPSDHTAAQQTFFEQVVANAQRRMESFEAVVKLNTRDFEKCAKDFRTYQRPIPKGRAVPPDTWRTTTAHAECARCTRRHSSVSLECRLPVGRIYERPFPQRWASPPRPPLIVGGPSLPVDEDDIILPDAHRERRPPRRARQQQDRITRRTSSAGWPQVKSQFARRAARRAH